MRIQLCGIVGPHLSQVEQSWAETAAPVLPGLSRANSRLPGAAFSGCSIQREQPPGSAIHAQDRLLVIADARLDGVAELRESLGQFAPVKTANPAELIAAAWQCWGRDCPQFLFGDYAFVVYDAASNETFCARDHIGARPFFYALGPSRLAFSSALPALHALPWIDLTLDESFVATILLTRKFEPRGETFHHSVRRLPAGHCLHVVGDMATLSRWWKPKSIRIRHEMGDAEAIGEARRLLELAVAARLVGASKTAVHLSGGIDSSLVAAMAAAALDKLKLTRPTGYSWQEVRPDAGPDSDSGWSEAMRAALDLELRSPRLDPQELAELLLSDWTAGPDVRNLLHESAIQRDAAKDGVELILSGWGGDEGLSFHGRGLNPQLLATGRWLTLYREGSPPGFRNGLRAFYGAARRIWTDFGPRKSLAGLIERRKSLIDPAFARQTQLLKVPRVREFGVQATQIALLTGKSSTTNRIEDWALSGAKHGITYAYPLLDRRLLEFVFRLPPRMFKRRGQDRWLARQLAKGLIPELIRCNTRKDEPVRTDQMSSDLAEAFQVIAPLLDQPSAPLVRARYIDMPALRRELAKAVESGVGIGRGLRAAIQFLDLR